MTTWYESCGSRTRRDSRDASAGARTRADGSGAVRTTAGREWSAGAASC